MVQDKHAIYFPGETVTPSVETIYIEGYKFDICEFNTDIARSEFKVKKAARFFLIVEDSFYNYSTLERGMSLIGVDIWETYCASKAEINALIKDFENKIQVLKKWQERADRIYNGEQFLKTKYNAGQVEVEKIKRDILNRFGLRI